MSSVAMATTTWKGCSWSKPDWRPPKAGTDFLPDSLRPTRPPSSRAGGAQPAGKRSPVQPLFHQRAQHAAQERAAALQHDLVASRTRTLVTVRVAVLAIVVPIRSVRRAGAREGAGSRLRRIALGVAKTGPRSRLRRLGALRSAGTCARPHGPDDDGASGAGGGRHHTGRAVQAGARRFVRARPGRRSHGRSGPS